MATIQDVFSHIYTTEAHLGDVPVKNGQIILCTDSEKLYIDHGTTRVGTSDVVQVENQEALPLAPLDKFYITQDTKDIFFYINGTWAKLTDTITDYTAFNVYAHDTVIPAGYNAVFDETFMVEVPASMTHKFIIRSRQNKNLQDVMVNWGDGAITSLKDDDVPWETVGDRRYTVSHTYSTPGTYTVKVYGTTFFGIWHYDTTENILCEALTSYLPVSSRHQNLGDFLHGSQCLTWLECGLSTFLNKNDLWGLCQNCRNLTRALGFSALPKMYSQKRIFDGCINLTTTDFVFSSSIDTPDGYAYAFHNCEKLTRSLKDFFPSVGFLCKKIDFTQTFQNTPLITWSDEVPQKLWKDPTIEWVNTNLTFDGCSDNLRSHIPTSWGGTSTAEIVGNLPVPKLSLNSILPNTANGLLMLNASGKVDSSLLPEQAPTNIDNYTSNSTIKLTSTAGAVDLISNTGEVGLYSGSNVYVKALTDTVELKATTVSLNGHAQNTSGGFVVVDSSTGKIPASIVPETAGSVDLSAYNGLVGITTTGASAISNGASGEYKFTLGTNSNGVILTEDGSTKSVTVRSIKGIHLDGGEVSITGYPFRIHSNGKLELSSSQGNIILNAQDSVDANIEMHGTGILWNGAALNTANGLVQLDGTGKILASQLPEMTQSWTKVTINQSSFATSDNTYGGSYYELTGICSVEVYDAGGYKVEFDVKCDFTGNKTRVYIPSGLAVDTISNWTLLYLAKTIA